MTKFSSSRRAAHSPLVSDLLLVQVLAVDGKVGALMQYDLPADHGLSQTIRENKKLVFFEEGGSRVALTDIQHAALVNGVARGVSLLVVAPTSTGKTQIGLWALLAGLERRMSAVYLVTHRALARQKFEDFAELLIGSDLVSADSLVLASGDMVRAWDKTIPSNPLGATLLVATYEKYLALLSSAGVPSDMTDRVVICDEIQIIGDRTRGQSIEILLTILKRARWGQLVGLSAVLKSTDAAALAQWLDVKLVHMVNREKHLVYECMTKEFACRTNTEHPRDEPELTRYPKPRSISTIDIVKEHVAIRDRVPIIVFCMSKATVYSNAAQYYRSIDNPKSDDKILSEFDEDTPLSKELSNYIPNRFAFHSADLTDRERKYVEDLLLQRKIDIVFTTSTLAAGVNFPLCTAIFDAWKRYNFERKSSVPIDPGDFHNMAGRVGRMGADGMGRIVFTAQSSSDLRLAKLYLNPDHLIPIESRITGHHFLQLVLQIVSAGFCKTESEVVEFLSSTFSGDREAKANQTGLDAWRTLISQSISKLKLMGFIE